MQMSEQIIQVLDYLGEKLGVSIDWTSENVLPYVQTLCDKYINWEIATSIIWIICGLAFIIPGIICLKYCIKNFKNYQKYLENKTEFKQFMFSDDIACLFRFISGCLLIIGFVIIFCQSFDIIKCIYFPELKIYEYIKELMQ